MEATSQALNELKQKEASKERKLALEKQAAMDSAAVIKEKTVKMTGAAGSNGKLFGSVTSKEIAEAVNSQLKIAVDKKKVSLEGDIKTYGTFNAEVKFGHSVSAKIFVLVSE